MKSATKSKFLAFFAVIALFSAVIFAGGCDGSSSSSKPEPETKLLAGVINGEMRSGLAEQMREEGIKLGEFNPEKLKTELAIIANGALPTEEQKEKLRALLENGVPVALEKPTEEQLAWLGEETGLPLAEYKNGNGIQLVAIAKRSEGRHVLLLPGKFTCDKVETKTYKCLEDSEESIDEETERETVNVDGKPEGEQLKACNRQLARLLLKWVKQGIDEAADKADEGRVNAAAELEKELINDPVLKTQLNNAAKSEYAPLKANNLLGADPGTELSKIMSADVTITNYLQDTGLTTYQTYTGSFRYAKLLCPGIEQKIVIYGVHSFTQDRDYYVIQHTTVSDPSSTKIEPYIPSKDYYSGYSSYSELDKLKWQSGWLIGFSNGKYWPNEHYNGGSSDTYNSQGPTDLFHGKPGDSGFFDSEFVGWFSHFPHSCYTNETDGNSIYCAWKWDGSTDQYHWVNYAYDIVLKSELVNDKLKNAGMSLDDHYPSESTKEDKTVTEGFSWNIGGSISLGINQKTGGGGNIGISGGASYSSSESRAIKEYYVLVGSDTVNHTTSAEYNFYDNNDSARRMDSKKNVNTSNNSYNAFKGDMGWIWSFDSKQLRSLSESDRSFYATVAYTSCGHRRGKSREATWKLRTCSFKTKVTLPLPARLTAQNSAATINDDKVAFNTILLGNKGEGGSAQTASVTVYSNEEWSLSSSQAWCKPQITKGPAAIGGTYIGLTVENNTGSGQREAEITVTDAKGGKAKVTVIQTENEPFGIYAQNDFDHKSKLTNISFNAVSNPYTLQLVSPYSWTAESSENWLHVAPASGSSTVGSAVDVIADPNLGGSTRNGKIIFKYKDSSGKSNSYAIDVKQYGN